MYVTTHILNVAHGIPASGVKVEFWHVDANGKRTFKEASQTNEDGRLDEPILFREAQCTGVYELLFYIGDYYRAIGERLPDPAFIDKMPLRFGISEAAEYHVPVMVTPWSFTTLRGS